MSLRQAAGRLAGAPRRVGRRLTYWLRPPALILMYHRVARLPSDPQLMAVTPEHFADHLEVLRRHARPCSMKQMVASLRQGQIPPRAVAITLDDGYADNLLNAEPLLSSYDIPATVFVTSGQVGSSREFWWDELEGLLLQPGTLPQDLELSVGGTTHRWNLGAARAYDGELLEGGRGWHIERPDDPSPQHALYRSVYHLLHDLAPAEREAALEVLRRQAGSRPLNRPTHRALSLEELVALSKSEVVEVAAHTVNHPVLSLQPIFAQRHEIRGSKAHLEEALDQPVAGFAYPHGAASAETVGLVREAGFGYACSTATDVVIQGADLFKLPRLGVRDWDPNTFRRFLSYWLDG
jgi:peptidoglycan/xylan/chitin deacetylase (PgdA/CDA1 family)